MNPAVEQLYADYLQRTDSDTTAAASLTLADVMQSARDTDRVEATLPGQPLTVPEVARLLRVRQDKVLNWIRRGDLQAFNIADKQKGRPKYRISPEDLKAFRQRRSPLPPVPQGRPSRRYQPQIEQIV